MNDTRIWTVAGLVTAIVFGYNTQQGLKTGKIRGRFNYFSRSQSPIVFWSIAATNVVFALVGLLIAASGIFVGF